MLGLFINKKRTTCAQTGSQLIATKTKEKAGR